MIEVWAPDADTVEIVAGPPGAEPSRHDMVRDDRGWWRWDGAHAAYEELDYAFVIDGEEPALPDPRSAWQPYGVDGPSRTFDVGAHEWQDTTWRGPRDGHGTLGGVIYELHVGTFTPEGTFNAAIARLDHLVELGVDVVEILPVAAIPGRWGWGYDGVDLYAVHDALGGPAGFQRFVDACHARGLGVCLDVVYNHLGPSGNYLGRFGPYFTESHMTPWGPAVNLDAPGSEEVRRFVVENALRWLRDFHVDALRLDAVHALVDESERHLLVELSDAVADLSRELGRPLDLIAESDLNDTTMVTPVADGGLGMTAQWADDVHHGLHVALTGETQGYYEDFGGGTRALPDGGPLDVLDHVLTRGFLHDGRWSSFRGREWGRPVDVDRLDGRRLVTYLQTHDQVGNRATGDRIGATLTSGRCAIGAALYLLGPGTPMVFMGEEWGAATPWQFFTDFTDEAMAEAVRTGRRGEFAAHGWAEEAVPDPQAESTREASVLRWNELSADRHAALFAWYRQLIALRRKVIGTSETRFADVSCSIVDGGATFVMTHRGMTVTADLAGDAVTVSADGIPTLEFS
ncbi:maltooligosyl trehalose hydrolase [Knoellia remsis]|uniref:Malto-oligosyltrehalose trehalohydrolase n=1 Tax=Knoellia remsis TaxID=407159 RepID=A0A2T0UTV9_9MICO|nr:malto-oligosyltrehalose trehalohydrolase [Knoellia remsis]PRY61369.1 maltooligosyl trehalose hydrolase [Knoellia remsis]